MAKIHDWNRVYWRNSSGEREFFDRANISPRDDKSPDDLDDDQRERYDELVEENDRAIYQNDYEDLVGYRTSEPPEGYSDDDEADEEEADEGDEPTDEQEDEVQWHGKKYEVFFQWHDEDEREVIEDVEFEDDPQDWVDEEAGRPAEVDLAAFDTRGDARKFAAAWRAEFGSPEDLGYFQYDPEDLPEEYQELRQIAQQHDIRGNQSAEDLRAQLTGEEEPEFANGHARAEAQ